MLMIRAAGTSMLAALAAALLSTSALAQHLDPLPGKAIHVGPYAPPYVAPPKVKSGTWTTLKAGFPGASFPDTSEVLTDGTVLMHDGCTADWYKLTPDKTGSYVNGKWTKAASMPAAYTPLYFAAQILSDGRLIANGGEYISCNPVWTNLGALYDPVQDKWTAVPAPSGWAKIGDAQSTILPDGTYMLADCCTTDSAQASISGTDVTWTILHGSDTGKADVHDEEGWTALPDQTLLTVDANRDLGQPNDVEIFTPSNTKWTGAGKTAQSVVDPGSHELGPAPLLPTGFIFQVGATGNNDVYDVVAGKWKAGPQFKVGSSTIDAGDGPAVVLPNGHALVQVSPTTGCPSSPFCAPSHFFEVQVNGLSDVTVKQVDEPASASGQASYEGRLLMLPTGQAFWTSDVGDIQIYTPKGHAKAAWHPVITSVKKSLTHGSTNNKVQGTLFNGLTEGGYYGDDAQMATNFPLVRITNSGTGDICYARTHDFSTRGISTAGAGSTAKFDIPNSCETGASTLEVVVNGIASAAKNVTIN